MSLPKVSPEKAKRLIDQGATLVDIRGGDEYARESIAGARNRPVDEITTLDAHTGPLVFYCRTGQRTTANTKRLADSVDCEAYILEGGMDAWKQAGLPVVADRNQPIEIQRQVQIAAGGLVLLGAALGYVAHPAFYILSALIGGGLVFVGVSGWCGMAKLFALMPWNKPATPQVKA
jgi:rhodanese-related sulfurtransferase